ncbi:MAG: heme biosynthesis HemY N-terminal domain-containing protein [Filomicrobium sp.]
MLRLILFLAFIIAMASGLAWLADRPGLIVVNWEGYQAEISVFHAVVALALLTGVALVIWSLLRHIWESPAMIGTYFNRRRQKRGLDALSTGMIAIGAGDRSAATKYAIQARKSMPNEPLTHLLRAQAAQLSGDKATARRIYESMLASTDTEQLGLRGLFLEAEREGELEAAKQFAERAVALNPQLSWPVDALFELQCKSHDWQGALATLAIARKHGHVEKTSADRRRAVLMTAQAQDLEDKDPERALNLALDANKLAADLIPAAAIAGRILASRGNTPKAAKLLQKTWQKAPHPDLATAYAYARLGDSPRDRLDRVKKLAALNPHSLESAIAVANASIEASDFDSARKALNPLLENRLTQRVCTLMARVEGEEHGDKGAVREWLARAVNAPRDPAWTADGVVSEQWAAVSPVTGALDAFRWRVPVENMDKSADEIVARKLEELVALGAPIAVATKDVTPNGDAKGGDTSDSPPAAATKGSASSLRPTDVSDADVVDVTVVPDKGTPANTAEPAKSAKTELGTPASATDNTASESEPPKVAPVAMAAATKDAKEPESAKKSEAKAQAADKEPKGDASKTSTTEEVATAAAPPVAAASPAVAKGTDPRPEAQKVEPAAEKKAAPAPTAETASASTAAAKAAAEKPAAKAAASEATEKPSRRGASEARIFVSPRAPDDPGPTDLEPPVDVKGPPKPYRVHS